MNAYGLHAAGQLPFPDVLFPKLTPRNTGPMKSPGFPWWLIGKESACNAGAAGAIPGSGVSPGGGHGNHSSVPAWRILRTEEPVRLQSIGSQRVRGLKRLSLTRPGFQEQMSLGILTQQFPLLQVHKAHWQIEDN